MGAVIRSIGWGGENGNEVAPRATKATGLLFDGTQVAMVLDNNQAGVSGDGGDNTGVPGIYFYTADYKSNVFSLKTSFAVNPEGGATTASMAIDSSDNVHVTWQDAGNEIYYRKLTYNPTTKDFSNGAIELVLNVEQGFNTGRLDIDSLGTSSTAVVVSTLLGKRAPDGNQYLKMCVRTTGGDWVEHSERIFDSTRHAKYTDGISVAAGQGAPVSNVVPVAVAFLKVAESTGRDYGDECWVYKYNITSGAQISSHKNLFPSGFNVGRNGGHRMYKLFCTYSSGDVHHFVLAGCVGIEPWTVTVAKAIYNQTTEGITRRINVTPVTTAGTRILRVDPNMWTDFFYHNNTVTCIAMNHTRTYQKTVSLEDDEVNAWPGISAWDNGYKALGVVPPRIVRVGTSRNHDITFQPGYTGYTSAGTTTVSKAYRIETTPKVEPKAPIAISPTLTVRTSIPVFGAQIRQNTNLPQFPVIVEWQIIPIGGDFDSPADVRTLIEPFRDFQGPSDTASPTYSKVFTYQALTVDLALTQGVWRVRAREIDLTGTASTWSSVSTFTVTHPPTASLLQPRQDAVTSYGSVGRTVFSWIFTDSYLLDNQTGYSILVQNVETGATVLSTGKISSSSSQVAHNLPESAKDRLMRWRVTLWDQDDVQGSPSAWATFTPSQSPVPILISPAHGSTIGTATPLIVWRPGVGDIKTQKAFSINLFAGKRIIWRTPLRLSTANIMRVPVGLLENQSTYSVSVRVIDNLNLEGQATATFHTDWPIPDSIPGLHLDPSAFSSRGFVWVTQSVETFDEDIIGINLYRRKVTETSWVQVYTWSDTTKVMSFRDYLVTPDVEYEYVATQIADRFGDVIESEKDPSRFVRVTVSNSNYWLVRSIDNLSFGAVPLYNVTSDQFTDQYESESYNIIGRGRHTDYGDRLGYSGSLTAQLRPKYLKDSVRGNLAHNPGQRMRGNNSNGYPDLWEPYSSNVTNDMRILPEATYQIDPAYTGTALSVTAVDFGTAGQQVGVTCITPIDEPSRGYFTTSLWVYDVMKYSSDFRFVFATHFYDEAGAIVASGTLADAYPSESDGKWSRFVVLAQVPSTAVKVRARFYIAGEGNVASEVSVISNALQVEHGADVSAYTDGEQLEGVWKSTEEYSPTVSDGHYTARKQRLDIEAMKNDRLDVYLRGPFGDLWRVAVGDLQFTRIAGTGTMELTDVVIPYEEVSEG